GRPEALAEDLTSDPNLSAMLPPFMVENIRADPAGFMAQMRLMRQMDPGMQGFGQGMPGGMPGGMARQAPRAAPAQPSQGATPASPAAAPVAPTPAVPAGPSTEELRARYSGQLQMVRDMGFVQQPDEAVLRLIHICGGNTE
ncbi:hypothetical protein KIPB_015015, partial [Kipferlia bialata]